MKSVINSLLLILGGATMLTSPASAAVNLASGDLAVVFYQVVGGTVQPNTYVFDLGQAGAYRETPGYSVSTIPTGPASGNIGTDLVNTFGLNWHDAGTLRWMVVGNVGQIDPTINGDPTRTSYLSRAVATLPASGVNTTFPTISATNRGILSNNIEPFFDNTNISTQTVGANPAGAIVNKDQFGSIDEYLPPTTTTFFGIGTNPYQTLNAGVIGNSGEFGTIEGALDIYRVLDTTVDADLTAAYSTGDAIVGSGQYIGRLLLSQSGEITMIPEPSSSILGALGVLGLTFRRRRNK